MSRTQALSALTATLLLTLTAPAVASPAPDTHASQADARKTPKAHLSYTITPYPRSSRTWDVAVTLLRKGRPLPNKTLKYQELPALKGFPDQRTHTDATGVAHFYYGNNEPITLRVRFKGNKKTRPATIRFVVPANPPA